jgi:hypothetical protein
MCFNTAPRKQKTVYGDGSRLLMGFGLQQNITKTAFLTRSANAARWASKCQFQLDKKRS